MCIHASYYVEIPSLQDNRTALVRGEQWARYPEVGSVHGRLQKPKESWIIISLEKRRRHVCAAVSKTRPLCGIMPCTCR